jgi:hypothetical protein
MSVSSTSRQFFRDYIERVQEQLALFTLPDEDAKDFFQTNKEITKYKPKFFIFEILFRNSDIDTNDAHGERMFNPYVSEKVTEVWNSDSIEKSFLQFFESVDNKKIDLSSIEWGTKETREKRQDFQGFQDDLMKLQKIYRENQRISESSSVLLEEDQQGLARETFNKLIRRYAVEYIPTNTAASAVLYEAWKYGKFLSSDSPEPDRDKFQCLMNALFVNTEGKSKQSLLVKMAEDLGLDHLKKLDESKLSNNAVWQSNIVGGEWFGTVENSLIHRFKPSKKSGYYLIHYPLIIDGYWFVGFVYFVANADEFRGHTPDQLPEIFQQNKYTKLYSNLKTVSETLRFSLRFEALSKIPKLLQDRMQDQNIFIETVKDYFVCFDVRPSDVETSDRESIHTQSIYKGNKIKIYGPEWIRDIHIEKIKQELEGKRAIVGVEVPGLFAAIKLAIKEAKAIKLQGRQEQGSLFAHQAAGLVNEVWGDRELRSDLHPQAKGCLWHLRSLIEINGDFDLEARKSICDGAGSDFREKEFDTTLELINYFIDISLRHALRRASYRRAEETPETRPLDERVKEIADGFLQNRDVVHHLDQIKSHLQWQPLEGDLPDWFRTRGFITCFHHCFWQSAYHAFRAKCDDDAKPPYLWIEIADENKITIFNRESSLRNRPENLRARDADFYKILEKRMDNFIKIEGPNQNSVEGYWEVSICRPN